jgi:hypothetical protein
MEIDPTMLNGNGVVFSVPGEVGPRMFVLLPPREDWERIVRGEKVKAPPSLVLYEPYEQQGAEGTWFQKVTFGAFLQANLKSLIKIDPRALPALDALPVEERQQVLVAAVALQQQDPVRWPKELVIRVDDDKPFCLLRASPSLRAFIRIQEGGELELFDIAREETLRWFGKQAQPAGVHP